MTEGRGSALLWFSAFYYLRVVRDFTERIEISRASPLRAGIRRTWWRGGLKLRQRKFANGPGPAIKAITRGFLNLSPTLRIPGPILNDKGQRHTST